MGTTTERPILPIENLGEQHLPCVILVDTSHSMRGYEQQLTEAIQNLKNAIENDDTARGRVEVCLVTYDDDVREESAFSAISKMRIPTISCGGMTRTHIAIKFALDRLAERKQDYVKNHVMYNQPWICLLTDGESNDVDNGAFEELLEAQRSSKCVFFGIAIGDQANEKELAGMHKNGIVLKVDKENLSSAFEFISQSVNPASAHTPGEKIKVQIPDSIKVKQITPESGSPVNKSKLKIYPVDKNSWSQDMPVIKEYDDRYDQASWDEVNLKCAEGDPYALYEKANRFRIGKGVEADKTQALYYYGLVLHKQKNTCALYYGGIILNEDFHSDYCVKYFQMGSELGDYDCSYELGNLYRYGEFVEKNPETAIQYFQLSVQQGEPKNYTAAGEVCNDLQDYQRSMQFFTLAAQADEPYAYYYIGRLYYYGDGVQEDDTKAFSYLKQASEKGINDGNVLLATLYGFGLGTTKDVNKALKLLEDVPDEDISDAYLTKGKIFNSEGNSQEGQKWLQKSAQMGNDVAQRLLSEGAGKKEEEQANEVIDPESVIRSYEDLVAKNELRKASSLIFRARKVFPDNLDIRERCAKLLEIVGAYHNAIGDAERAIEVLSDCLSEIEFLRSNNRDTDKLRKLEESACYFYGLAAFKTDKCDLAFEMFSKVDQKRYLYKTVIKMLIRMSNSEYYDGLLLANDAKFLRDSMDSFLRENHTPQEQAIAYSVLADIYSKGIPNHLHADVKYAYSCIQKCAEIDPELAKPEIARYSKNLFGIVTYK